MKEFIEIKGVLDDLKNKLLESKDDHFAIVQIQSSIASLNESIATMHRKHLALLLLMVDKKLTSWEELDEYNTKAVDHITKQTQRMQRLNRTQIPKAAKLEKETSEGK